MLLARLFKRFQENVISMPIYEVCQISLKNEDHKSGGLFGTSSFTMFYLAEKISPAGNVELGSSPKVQRKINLDSDEIRRSFDLLEKGYQNLLAQLLADGWEPVGANEDGNIITLKRPIEKKND